jgi:hypothetical protein
LTDAGRSAEWAEFFDAFAPHPQLAGLLVGLPGNHDVNVVDRANPARLDLPTSPKMIASGQLHILVAATYPLSSIKEAVAHAQRGGKMDVAGSST